MTTRAILQAEIIDDMERDATSDGARVLAAISNAIKFYQPKRFFFNESRSVTFPTVAGTDTYDFGSSGEITTEFYTIDGVFLTHSTDNIIELRPRNYLGIETLSTTQAEPYSYAYINRALWLYPVPDAVYTVRLDGHIKAAEPDADSTADNVWFTEAYEVIHCRAKAYLYAHVWFDANMAIIMRQAEQEALTALRGATTSKVGTGQLIPTQF